MPQPSRSHRVQLKYNVTTDSYRIQFHILACTPHLPRATSVSSSTPLSHGQPVNSVLDGVLPLHAASAGGNVLVVNFLIDRGADVNAPRLPRRYSDRNRDTTAPIVGTSGSTPLHFAAANGHLAVVRTLLSCGAVPDRADKHGITPELIARQNGWIECADTLAEATTSKVSPQSNPASHQRSTSACPVENLEASLRKRLHFKRSVDRTLSGAGGTSDPEVKSSHRSDQEPLSHDSQPRDNSVSTAAQTIPIVSGRRPSLPQALDESSITPSFTRCSRPRSAGTGADSRKLHSKISLLSLFKKSNADGSSSSVSLPFRVSCSLFAVASGPYPVISRAPFQHSTRFSLQYLNSTVFFAS
ncbi:ankyrin repeat-containing domain protein [Chiua virens]|nr:ankyrin repeat-containing domain protein [Chiua virens]